jgi:hypothetical protein
MQWWSAAALSTLLTASAMAAPAAPSVYPVKDKAGETYGVIVTCNKCKAPAASEGKKCHTGVEDGWLDGKACGKCLINENYGARLSYPYDLQIAGKLVDDDGQPIKNRFVKLFMANGWSVRSRTSDDGTFRMMLGATAERKSKQPLTTDVGVHADLPKDNEANYALYFLPESYKPCSESSQPQSKKAKKKP